MGGERMTQVEMDALRAVMAEATPGPWQADFGGFHFSSVVNDYEDIGECIEARNGQAIVAAVNAVPRLLAEVERLRCVVGHLTDDVDFQKFLRDSLSDSVEHYQKGIKAYRDAYRYANGCRGGGCTCRVHSWEREDAERNERP